MTPITALPTELAAMREVVETLAPIERAASTATRGCTSSCR
ncbi:Uncharacterised protein [Mycobacterium tuberculosis]|nr:Uncharacterised protein [Mycobacterium tuberculosis]